MVSWNHGLDRRLEGEWMDRPGLETERLHQALAGLARLNRWSRSASILWPPLAAYAAARNLKKMRVLDVASGAGDVTLGLWRRARRTGLDLAIDGWDINPRAVDFARERAARAGAAVAFFSHDALADPIPPDYDAVVSSLFLHHLDERQAMLLLGRMAWAAQGLLLISDLRRSRAGLGLAHAAAHLLTRSDVVHNDAPASVRSAFTVGEMAAMAERIGLMGASISRVWPFRFLLEWERR